MSVIVVQHEITLLSEWFIIIQEQEDMHRKAFSYYKRINYCIMIPIIIFTGVSGAIGFANVDASYNKNNTAKYINIWYLINGCLGVSSAILTTIYNFMSIPELQQDHHFHHKEYNKLAREISTELILSNTNDKTYANLGEYIKVCKTRIDRLRDSSPQIPEFIYTDYKKKHKKNLQDFSHKNIEIYNNLKENENEKKSILDNSDNTNINNNIDGINNNYIYHENTLQQNELTDINVIVNDKKDKSSFEDFRIFMKKN